MAEAEKRSLALLKDHRTDLDLIAAALLVHEELDREEVSRVLKGLPVPIPRVESTVHETIPSVEATMPDPVPVLSFAGA